MFGDGLRLWPMTRRSTSRCYSLIFSSSQTTPLIARSMRSMRIMNTAYVVGRLLNGHGIRIRENFHFASNLYHTRWLSSLSLSPTFVSLTLVLIFFSLFLSLWLLSLFVSPSLSPTLSLSNFHFCLSPSLLALPFHFFSLSPSTTFHFWLSLSHSLTHFWFSNKI